MQSIDKQNKNLIPGKRKRKSLFIFRGQTESNTKIPKHNCKQEKNQKM